MPTRCMYIYVYGNDIDIMNNNTVYMCDDALRNREGDATACLSFPCFRSHLWQALRYPDLC